MKHSTNSALNQFPVPKLYSKANTCNCITENILFVQKLKNIAVIIRFSIRLVWHN